MKTNEKLHIVTRRDLLPEHQAIQSMHAMREFIAAHPEVDLAWYTSSNHLAYLEVADERALELLAERAECEGVPYAVFREPDMQDRLTAMAIAPSGRRICRRLTLVRSDRG